MVSKDKQIPNDYNFCLIIWNLLYLTILYHKLTS